MAVTTQLVPALADTIWPYLEATAKGAAGQCDGEGGTTCGYHWSTSTWDGTSGLGQQMAALAAVGTPMIKARNLPPPLTLKTGATSKVDLNTASNGDDNNIAAWAAKRPITTADRAGAWITTLVILALTAGFGYWLTLYSRHEVDHNFHSFLANRD
jgi:mannan endo-1,6-alpha-mannosidase